MKFIADGLTLSEAVGKVAKACAVRTTAPILECIKLTATLEGVSLLATDGELSICKSIKADVLEEGEICVPGKLFADFSSKLAGEEISLSTGEKGVELKYRDSVSYMQALPAADFPKIDLDVGENFFTMKAADFKTVIAETAFCCAQDDSRPILKGCLMKFGENLEIVALDGYRMAVSEAAILSKSSEMSIVCPARTLGEISRMLSEEENVTLYTQRGMLMAGTDGLTLVSRLYLGDFIKKENVIPSSFSTTVTVNRAELMASAERANILNRGDKNNLVTLEIAGETMRIFSMSDYGNVSECVDCATEGRELTISMNAKFLLEALKALSEERVTISLGGAVSPFILQNEQEKHNLYLILPVRNAS